MTTEVKNQITKAINFINNFNVKNINANESEIRVKERLFGDAFTTEPTVILDMLADTFFRVTYVKRNNGREYYGIEVYDDERKEITTLKYYSNDNKYKLNSNSEKYVKAILGKINTIGKLDITNITDAEVEFVCEQNNNKNEAFMRLSFDTINTMFERGQNIQNGDFVCIVQLNIEGKGIEKIFTTTKENDTVTNTTIKRSL